MIKLVAKRRQDIPDWMIVKAYHDARQSYRVISDDPKYYPLNRSDYRDRGNKLILEYMKRISEHKDGYKLLDEQIDGPWKVIYSAIERCYERDLIEYGSSLRTAWPTDKGLELLKQVDQILTIP